jgi:SAM-dependent methyltransferase
MNMQAKTDVSRVEISSAAPDLITGDPMESIKPVPAAGGGAAPQPNKFDQMVVDVDDLYARVPLGTNPVGATPIRVRSPLAPLYGTRLLPLQFRRFLSRLLRRTHLDLSWFEAFNEYWTTVLGGRTLLTVHDFYFLKNVYRSKFQHGDVAVEDTPDATVHLDAWQRPEVLYQLLHLAEKEALFDHAGVFRRVLKVLRPRVILEFGCGTAPIVTSLRQFGYRSIRAYIADIKTVTFHYGAFKFADDPEVRPILLQSETHFALPEIEPLDVAFCVTVFEHLNRPMATAQRLHAAIRPGGLLVFDYISGGGDGLDTLHGARERNQVLDFIARNFDIVQGDLDPDGSTALTIARKR